MLIDEKTRFFEDVLIDLACVHPSLPMLILASAKLHLRDLPSVATL